MCASAYGIIVFIILPLAAVALYRFLGGSRVVEYPEKQTLRVKAGSPALCLCLTQEDYG